MDVNKTADFLQLTQFILEGRKLMRSIFDHAKNALLKQLIFMIPLRFTETGDPEYTYICSFGGNTIRIRVNDFPEEPLYSIFINDFHAKDALGWPARWVR